MGTETTSRSTLLDLDVLRPDAVQMQPYQWASVGGLLDLDAAGEFRDVFPSEGFFPNEGHDGEKSYRHRMRPLLTQGADRCAPSAPPEEVWHRLVAELLAPEFRIAMGRMLGADVSRCGVEASLFRYGAGDWLGPHRDLPAMLASLIVYLNDGGWDRETGGCLRILALLTDLWVGHDGRRLGSGGR